GGDNRVEGTVASAVYMGNYADYQVEVGEVRLRVQTKPSVAYREGDRVALELPPRACVCIPEGADEG
ncbi:MAG TPA: TOBE domain-containing protein, partial [Candidatus Methylomirabilis sp.]